MPELPPSMKAIVIRAPGGPEMLVEQDRPMPVPGPGEILVRVDAAGVNRPDVRQREGNYPPPKGATDIPGLEIAGEVIASRRFKIYWLSSGFVAAVNKVLLCGEHRRAIREPRSPVPSRISGVG